MIALSTVTGSWSVALAETSGGTKHEHTAARFNQRDDVVLHEKEVVFDCRLTDKVPQKRGTDVMTGVHQHKSLNLVERHRGDVDKAEPWTV